MRSQRGPYAALSGMSIGGGIQIRIVQSDGRIIRSEMGEGWANGGVRMNIPLQDKDFEADKCNTLGDRRLNIDGLDVNGCQCQCMREQSNKHLFVDERCVPRSQMSSDERSTSEYMMVWIPRLGDHCGQ